MVGVLVAEPNPVLRLGIGSVLEHEADIDIVAEAVDVDQLSRRFLDAPHDVVLIELGFLKRIGLRTLNTLREIRPGSRLLVHSYDMDVAFAVEALGFDAAGFLSNHCASDEWKHAIATVAAGQPYMAHAFGEEVVMNVCFRPSTLAETALSGKELKIFKMFAIGLDVDAIAAQMNLQSGIVASYKARILKKLNLPGVNELVRHAICASLSRQGFYFAEG